METVPKRFFVVRKGPDTSAMYEGDLDLLGIKADDLQHLYPKGIWETIELHRASAGKKREIAAKMLVRDEITGFRSDPSLLPGARCEVMVASWPYPDKPSIASFEALEGTLPDVLNAVIEQHLSPSLWRDPDFLSLASGKQQPSKSE